MSDQPDGWAKARLAHVAEVRLGRQRSPKTATGERMRPYLRAANVKWGGLDLTDVKEMAFTPAESETYELRPGDVLLGEASGSPSEVGKPGQYRGQIVGCCFQNTLLRVRFPDSLQPDFYEYFFREQALNGRFAAGSRGVGIHHLGAGALSDWAVPVASRAEEERIVAAIDEAFSKVDAGEASLRTVRQRLSRMRRAASAFIFRGLNFEYECREVCSAIVDCPHSTAAFVPEGLACLDTTCMAPGRVVRERLRYVSPETWLSRTRRLTPEAGDVVFAREGTIGTAVCVPEGFSPCLGQRVMLLRPGPELAPRFLEQALMAPQVRAQYAAKVVGSTAPHLNVRDVKALRSHCHLSTNSTRSSRSSSGSSRSSRRPKGLSMLASLVRLRCVGRC